MRALLAGAVVLCALVVAAAQAPVPSSSTNPQPPTFRSGSDVVQVDVVVTDKSGRFVDDLRADDFELQDERIAQPIDQFFLVSGTAAPATPAPGTEPHTLAPRTVAPAGSGVFIAVFDDDHLTPGGFKRVQAAALALFTKQFRPGDIGGVVERGRMANNRLTSDKEELLAAVRNAKPNSKSTSRTMELREWPSINEAEAIRIVENGPGDQQILDSAVQRACEDQPDMCAGRRVQIPIDTMIREKASRVVGELLTTANQTLTTLDALLNGLQRVPNRKTVILLTEGFVAEHSWPRVEQSVELAARANARIYTLDARGLYRERSISDYTPHEDSMANLLASFDIGADAINSLAVDTGGFVVRNTNIFDDAVAQIARDAGTYYVLGFRPTALRDGKFHRIKVTVKRPGLVARARRGYGASPIAAPATLTAAATPSPAPGIEAPAPSVPAPAAPAAPAASVPAPSAPAASVPAPAAPAAPAASVPAPSAPAASVPAPAAPSASVPAPSAPSASVPGTPAPSGASVHLRPDDVKNVGALAANAIADSQATAGWEAYQRGDVETARASLSAAASSPSARPWVHYALGQAEYALRDFPAAIAAWERVRASSPDFEPVYFDLADGYLQTQEYEQAIKVLRAGQRRWPQDAEMFNALGVVQVKRNALDDAVKSFEEAVAVAPEEGVGYFNLAKALELRWIKSRRYNELTRLWVSNENDRRNAVSRYEQYLKIGGPLDDDARAGLQRLSWGAK